MTDMRQVAREEADKMVEPIRTTLWGPPHPSGSGRVSEDGMEGQLKEVHNIVTNGGVPRQKMESRTKWGIALLGAFAIFIDNVIDKIM